jgi:hypothetical protein
VLFLLVLVLLWLVLRLPLGIAYLL